MPRLKQKYPLYLAGEPRQPNHDLEVRNKYDGEVVSHVAMADGSMINRAIEQAVDCFNELRCRPAWRRKRVLEHVVAQVRARRDEFAHVLALEAGKPINDARGEVSRAIDTFTIAAEESVRLHGEHQSLEISQRGEGCQAIWKRVPVGPCSFITPWNFPLNLVAHKIGPALAVGCPFVLKPAATTPISALMLGEILADTDLPRGAFSICPCSHDHATALVEDERIKHLSFTGSVKVGWDMKSRAGRKKVTLELGGNAAVIVDATADIEHAAERIVHGAFYQSGQSCISVQRVLVHERVYDRFREQFIARTKQLRVGDPLDDETFIGPIISEDEAARIEEWVDEAREGGGKILTGGTRDGNLYEPTVVEDPPRDAKVSCDEVFGPVATLQRVSSIDEAIEIVNDSRYGLQAGIFTRDLQNAFRAWNEIECGGIIINDSSSLRVDSMPYGGVKESGFGREGVRFSMEEMTDLRLMVLKDVET